MARRHELSMESYGRLFPSQDTMPRGGFGNLIALPLQHGPRQEGNSVFLDGSFAAFPDDEQWEVLASVQRINPATVEKIAANAAHAVAEDAARWMRMPSGSGPTPTGRVDVAMIQSLVRRESVADLVTGYGQVIVDECHHLPAVSFERVLTEIKARYVVGLTATQERRDGHHPITQMQLGPVRFAVDAKSQAGRRPFEHRLVTRETAFRMAGAEPAPGVQQIYAASPKTTGATR